MANKRYGLKEVANVIFFDITTGKPKAFFDTLKVSTIENESETAEARGGQGNNKLMAWDYGRTANLTMSDALLSDTTIAMMAGQQAKTDNVEVMGREQKEAVSGGIVLDETPKAGSVTVFKYQDGLIDEELYIDVTGTTVDVFTDEAKTVPVADGVELMAFYTYEIVSGANQITFSGQNFPATYRVVGETFVRDENGVDHVMQFEIPKAKLQSTFSLTMDVENVATFDFNLEVLMDAKSVGKELYKLTRIDK
jgi:hypothetical protein